MQPKIAGLISEYPLQYLHRLQKELTVMHQAVRFYAHSHLSTLVNIPRDSDIFSTALSICLAPVFQHLE